MRFVTDHHRRLPLAAALAALGFTLEGALVARSPQGDEHWSAAGYVVEAAFVVALAAAVPVLCSLGLHRSRTTRIGAVVAAGGFAILLACSAPSLLLGRTVLGPLFLLGIATAVGGLAAASIPALARRPRSWEAPLALAGLVLGIGLGDAGGGMLLGLAWLGLAIRLDRQARVHDTAVAA